MPAGIASYINREDKKYADSQCLSIIFNVAKTILIYLKNCPWRVNIKKIKIKKDNFKISTLMYFEQKTEHTCLIQFLKMFKWWS